MEIKMPVVAGKKPGIVGKINYNENDVVKKDDILVNVETGKGNRAIKSTVCGTITKIHVDEGDEVLSNDILFSIEEIKEMEIVQNKNIIEEKLETDLLVIGAGPGGYVAAIYAAQNGLKVTLVDKNKLGGTCLNVGCIPTKALVKSSEAYYEATHLNKFGINFEGKVSYQMKNIVNRKNTIVDTLVSGIESLIKKNNIQYLKGNASFDSTELVRVSSEKNDYLVYAKDIIIATGSKVSTPKIPGVDLECVMNSTDALSNESNFNSITIVGGGVIGMEFACLYRNLGIEVNVVEFTNHLLNMLDTEISDEFERIIKDKGVNVYTSSAVSKIQMTNDKKAVITYKNNNKEYLLVSDRVLIATGREPVLDGLNLDKINLEMDKVKKGISVNSYMQTSIDHIYAIGDATNIIQLAHVASHQGMIAVDNILNKNKEMHYHAVPNVIFTSPEIASVGITEKECIEKGIEYKTSQFNYEGNGKALTMNATEGFVKIIQNKNTKEIIGASIIGADASSLISTLTIAVQNKLKNDDISNTIFAHPTTSEVIHEAILDLGLGAIHQ